MLLFFSNVSLNSTTSSSTRSPGKVAYIVGNPNSLEYFEENIYDSVSANHTVTLIDDENVGTTDFSSYDVVLSSTWQFLQPYIRELLTYHGINIVLLSDGLNDLATIYGGISEWSGLGAKTKIMISHEVTTGFSLNSKVNLSSESKWLEKTPYMTFLDNEGMIAGGEPNGRVVAVGLHGEIYTDGYKIIENAIIWASGGSGSEQSKPYSRKIAYIVEYVELSDDDYAWDGAIYHRLSQDGYKITLIDNDDINKTDFSVYDVILEASGYLDPYLYTYAKTTGHNIVAVSDGIYDVAKGFNGTGDIHWGGKNTTIELSHSVIEGFKVNSKAILSSSYHYLTELSSFIRLDSEGILWVAEPNGRVVCIGSFEHFYEDGYSILENALEWASGWDGSPQEGNFTISISPKIATISIGGNVKYTVTLKNFESNSDTFLLSVKGIDESWWDLSDTKVLMYPGDTVVLDLNIKIPNKVDTVGSYSIEVSMLSSNLKSQKSYTAKLIVNQNPILTELYPIDGTKTTSPEILFNWRTSIKSSTEVFIKTQDQDTYIKHTGNDARIHSLTVSNLQRNTWYDFYVKSDTEFGSITSEERNIYVSNGITFSERTYNFTIERDYNQIEKVTISNGDSKPHKILVKVYNPNSNFIVGFTGNGSQDRIVAIPSGDSMDLTLAMHAQDAIEESYQLILNLSSISTNDSSEIIYDIAEVNVKIQKINVDFTMDVTNTNQYTLAKTIKVVNKGDALTDFTVWESDELKRQVMFHPTIFHYNLGENEKLEFEVYPTLTLDFTGLSGKLFAKGYTKKVSMDIDFILPKGANIFYGDADFTTSSSASGSFCTNTVTWDNPCPTPPPAGPPPCSPPAPPTPPPGSPPGTPTEHSKNGLMPPNNKRSGSEKTGVLIGYVNNPGGGSINGQPATPNQPIYSNDDIKTLDVMTITMTDFHQTRLTLHPNLNINMNQINQYKKGLYSWFGSLACIPVPFAPIPYYAPPTTTPYGIFFTSIPFTCGGMCLSGIRENVLEYYPDIQSNNNLIPTYSLTPEHSHFVWHSGSPTQVIYLRREENGNNISVQNLAKSTTDAKWPVILADDEDVFAAWLDERDGNYEVYFTFSNDEGISWSKPKKISDSGNCVDDIHMAVNSTGALHMVWEEFDKTKGNIFYSISTDRGKTWKKLVQITNSSGISEYPNIMVGFDDTLHITWEDKTSGHSEVYYMKKSKNENNWSKSKLISPKDVDAGEPSLVVTNDGIIHVVWRDSRHANSEIYYRNSTDGGITFNKELRLTNDDYYSEYPKMIPISKNLVRIFWFDDSTGKNWLLYRDGPIWTEARRPPRNYANVEHVYLEMEFELNDLESVYIPHDLYVSINGVEVATLKNTVPNGKCLFYVDPTIINYGDDEVMLNTITTEVEGMNVGHFITSADRTLIFHLSYVEVPVVAQNQSHADSIVKSWYPGTWQGVDPAVYINEIMLSKPLPGEEESTVITARIRNLGEDDVSNVNVKFYDGDPNGDGIQIGSDIDILKIASYSWKDVNVTWTSSGGRHKIFVVVDQGDTIEETDETNNVAIVSVNVWSTSPPTGTIKINDDVATTSFNNVILTLSVAGMNPVSLMSISNDNRTWTDWELFVKNREWTLSEGDGLKTVYIKFMDASGLESHIYFDDIILKSADNVTVKDTDNDGFSDDDEKILGTDPKDATSYPGSDPSYRFKKTEIKGVEISVLGKTTGEISISSVSNEKMPQVPASIGKPIDPIFEVSCNKNISDIRMSIKLGKIGEITIPQDTKAESIKLCHYDEENSKWTETKDSTYDEQTGILSAKLDHLTIFAPMSSKVSAEEEDEGAQDQLMTYGILLIIVILIIIIVIGIVIKKKGEEKPKTKVEKEKKKEKKTKKEKKEEESRKHKEKDENKTKPKKLENAKKQKKENKKKGSKSKKSS